MTESAEELEGRLARLRAAVRDAVLAGDARLASALRRELRRAEHDWEDALAGAQEAAQETAAGEHEKTGGGKGSGQDREGAVLAAPASGAGTNAAGAQGPLLPQ